MKTPTIGRVLHYHRSGYEGAALTSQPMAAMIAHVNTDGVTVNLTVFDHNGKTFPALEVPLLVEGVEPPRFHYATWPEVPAAEVPAA